MSGFWIWVQHHGWKEDDYIYITEKSFCARCFIEKFEEMALKFDIRWNCCFIKPDLFKRLNKSSLSSPKIWSRSDHTGVSYLQTAPVNLTPYNRCWLNKITSQHVAVNFPPVYRGYDELDYWSFRYHKNRIVFLLKKEERKDIWKFWELKGLSSTFNSQSDSWTDLIAKGYHRPT